MKIEQLHDGLQSIDIHKFAEAIMHTINKSHNPVEAVSLQRATKEEYPALMVPNSMVIGYADHKDLSDDESRGMRNGATIAMIGLRELILVERMRAIDS